MSGEKHRFDLVMGMLSHERNIALLQLEEFKKKETEAWRLPELKRHLEQCDEVIGMIRERIQKSGDSIQNETVRTAAGPLLRPDKIGATQGDSGTESEGWK